MIALTHALFSLALGSFLNYSLLFLVIGSLFPDLDFLFAEFGLLHRLNFLHTPAFLVFLSVILYAFLRDERKILGFSLGYFSHLFLDTLTTFGILWLYPLEMPISLNLVSSNSPLGNGLIIFLSISIAYFNFKRYGKWKKI